MLWALLIACWPAEQVYACAWDPQWFPTNGWDSYPYGEHGIDTADKAIETSQRNRDYGYGTDECSCTHVRFIRIIDPGYVCGYRGERAEYEVFCVCPGGENPQTYWVRPRYYLTVEGPNNECTQEGNPCDAATGNKFQTEEDIVADRFGLGFTRYYNSQVGDDRSGDLGAGWSHSFNFGMDSAYAPQFGRALSVTSAAYTLPSEACSSGWADIQGTAFGGLLAGAEATYSNGLCTLNLGGSTQARLRVRSTLAEPTPQSLHTIHRPNGTIYTFYLEGSTWVSTTDRLVSLVALTEGWRFTDADGTAEVYDATGKLLTSTTLVGQTTSYTYDPNGKLEQVVGPTGRTLTFTRDLAGRIESVTAPDGAVYRYTYDATGKLASVAYPDDTPADDTDNPSRVYHYEDARFPYALTGITDENGVRFATWAYDDQGRAILSEHSGGAERVELTYNPDGTTTVRDAQGQVKTYHFEVVNGVLKPARIERQ